MLMWSVYKQIKFVCVALQTNNTNQEILRKQFLTPKPPGVCLNGFWQRTSTVTRICLSQLWLNANPSSFSSPKAQIDFHVCVEIAHSNRTYSCFLQKQLRSRRILPRENLPRRSADPLEASARRISHFELWMFVSRIIIQPGPWLMGDFKKALSNERFLRSARRYLHWWLVIVKNGDDWSYFMDGTIVNTKNNAVGEFQKWKLLNIRSKICNYNTLY